MDVMAALAELLGSDNALVRKYKENPDDNSLNDAIIGELLQRLPAAIMAPASMVQLVQLTMFFINRKKDESAKDDAYWELRANERDARLERVEKMVQEIHAHIFYSPPPHPDIYQPLAGIIATGSKMPEGVGFAEHTARMKLQAESESIQEYS